MAAMNTRHRTSRLGGLGLAVVAVAVTAGCAQQPKVEEHHPRWPAEPAEARIVHRRSLRGPADIARPSVLSRLGSLVAGENEQATLRPSSVAVQEGERLFVTDQELQGVHVFDLSSGKGRFVARAGKTYFVSPVGVAVCGSKIAFADSALNAVFVLTDKGKLLSRIDKPEGFLRPTGLAFDPNHSELYVVDTMAHEVCVFTMDGQLARRFGSAGSDIGQFNFPTHVFVDAQSQVYVTDSLNFRVQVFDRQGQYQFDIGEHGDASGHLGVPKGVAVDSFGHIYVVDSYFSTVQIFDRQGRFLLNFGKPGNASGQFHVPAGLTIDKDNRIYVCDSYNNRVQVFQYVGDTTDENETSPGQ